MFARPDGERNSVKLLGWRECHKFVPARQHVEHETAEEIEAKLYRHRHEQPDDFPASLMGTIRDSQPLLNLGTIRCIGVNDVPVEGRPERTVNSTINSGWFRGMDRARRKAPSRDLCQGTRYTHSRVQ